MYNPSRGGVRGGADQFTWESVKSDKHRENYLGHSLMAPVGRWQKGKDLSWYAKERKEAGTADKSDKCELASIKRAEEEAMLIALGHNIVRKAQTLSKEDMHEALKRNTGQRDEHNIERIDGVGASSQRVALLSGVGKNSRKNAEGVSFESRRDREFDAANKSRRGDDSMTEERKKGKKKSKKHKKEKKPKKHHKESYDSDSSDSVSKHRTKHKKNESDSDDRKSSRHKTHKKSKNKHKDHSDDSDKKPRSNVHQESHKRHRKQWESVKRCRRDSSESN